MDRSTENFEQFGLLPELMQAIDALGYELPTPIQRKTIPLLLEGKDVIGQAQTGTGKTAAFALPILQALDTDLPVVQALVLTPTRELGLQVAEAIHRYGKSMQDVRVLPIYGGQSMVQQLQRLRRGVHIVVGTPGRIMDHLRRGSLDFSHVKLIVIDEADEMLRMGFIDDVEWILGQAPDTRQTALFSATMPKEVRRVADKYLKAPVMVEIEHETMTVPNIQQRALVVPEGKKLDALSHLLEVEVEPGEAVLIFAKTKVGAAELAEKLAARGYAAESMHGDMNQVQRENVVRRLRSGQLEIVVATDVAARGWDVERIGIVVNYDIPYETESYVHRIGRTGRAGRTGKSILFVTPRQKAMQREIERYTGQRIEPFKLPTPADIAARRIALFKEQILKTLNDEDLDLYLTLVGELAAESGHDISEIAAATACMARGDKPLALAAAELEAPPARDYGARDYGDSDDGGMSGEAGMVRLFVDAGRNDGVRPSDIVGVIANVADIPGNVIGAIDIYHRFSFVDIPRRYLSQVLERMDGIGIRSVRDAHLRVATPRDEDAIPANSKARGVGRKSYKSFSKNTKKLPKRSEK
jgi:ATP-dependent RNA helicase DeaD